MATKVIFIFGGVYSSLGKGIVASSIGAILSCNGYKISMQKFDPYLNVDPGTLSPYQHGEVFVTKDGKETDLDLGNYQRFTNAELFKDNSITSGCIYWDVINNERKGKYNGKTIQVVPHITTAIKSKIYSTINAQKLDFLIVEIGGTVGDIESNPFTEAISQFTLEYGKENCASVLVAPLIYIGNGEIKTKPIQHSFKELCSLGIVPSFLFIRAKQQPSKDVISKISVNCHTKEENIFASLDQDCIYYVPCDLYKQKFMLSILKHFNMRYNPANDKFDKQWIKKVNKIANCKKEITIAIVGKYVELHDSYLSIIESLHFSSWSKGYKLNIKWVESQKLESEPVKKYLNDVDGIIVPGGFGIRGIPGKIKAITYARENKIPFLGICLGMQLATIEYAWNVLKIPNANSTEFDANCLKLFDKKDGDLILGERQLEILDQKSLAYEIYGQKIFKERFRYRYKFAAENASLFKNTDVKFATKGGKDQEFVTFELDRKVHPFFFAVQFHPEFTTTFFKPDKCFDALVSACYKFAKK